MAVSAQERLYLLSQVNQLAQTQLNQLWAQADQLSNADFAAFVVAAFPQIADPFISMSADLAASWFELSDPASDYIASVAHLPAPEKLTTSAEWALGATGDAGKDRLSGTLQRAVFDGARDTTKLNIDNTSSRWVRQARPDACAFCKMLATRSQELYRSAKSAKYVVGRGRDAFITFSDGTRIATRGKGKRPRGTQEIGEKFHDFCHCQPVEIRQPDNYQLPAHAQEWEDLYNKARADAGSGDPKAILAAWRQLDGSA